MTHLDLDLDALDALAAALPTTEKVGAAEVATLHDYDGHLGVLLVVGDVSWSLRDARTFAAFIAAARDAVPALTARVRELEASASSWERVAEGWRSAFDDVKRDADEARAEVARLRAQVDALNREATSWCDAATLANARIDAVTALCDEVQGVNGSKVLRTPYSLAREVRAALATGAES